MRLLLDAERLWQVQREASPLLPSLLPASCPTGHGLPDTSSSVSVCKGALWPQGSAARGAPDGDCSKQRHTETWRGTEVMKGTQGSWSEYWTLFCLGGDITEDPRPRDKGPACCLPCSWCPASMLRIPLAGCHIFTVETVLT